jgi:hypothetical protein
LIQEINKINKLFQERQVIQANTNRIEDLSQDLVNLANLQGISMDITPYQTSLVNEKRINLRNNLVDLKEGLQIHYHLGEETLRPLISVLCLKTLVVKHDEIISHLANVEIVILNLSPVGVLFNSDYLKGVISAIFLALKNLNCQESSLLAYSGISPDEEPD